MAAISTLQDAFTGATRDASKWDPYSLGSGAVAVQNDRLEITPANNASGENYAGYLSVATYDLTNDAAYVRLARNTLADSNRALLQMDLVLDANNLLIWQWNGGSGSGGYVKAIDKVAGTDTTTTLTYDATNHAWLRIRHDGANIVWETAPDDGSGAPGAWTPRKTKATPFAITALQVRLRGGTWSNVTTPGMGWFDGFNTAMDSAAPAFALAAVRSVYRRFGQL